MTNVVIEFPKEKRATKAVLLTRVSSKEQEEGYSVAAQKHRLETYCLRKDLDVIRTFEITESSYTGDRRKFMEMVKFIKSQNQPIALVADKVDRVQRSFREYPLLDGLIAEGKLELHFNTENQIIHQGSNSYERMMWSMSVMMAQSYIDSMRDNVKRSQEHKIRIGEWCGAAPVGYMNIKDANGRSDIILDPVRAPLIRKLFVEYSHGDKTLSELVQLAREWNLKNARGKKSFLQKSQIHAILNNPFYHGTMRIKGKLYPHRYEILVEKDLYDKCQSVLKGWHKKPFQWGKKEFVFRGLITCATSGRTVTADTKSKTYTSGKKSEWTYLRCWDPKNPMKKLWIREEKVLAQVEKVISQLHVPDRYALEAIEYFKKVCRTESEYQRRQEKELQHDHKVLINKKEALLELVLDQVISKEEYKEKKHHINVEIDVIKLRLDTLENGDEAFKESVISLFKLMSRAPELFKASTVAQKRKLINYMFANLTLKGPTLCFELKKPFDLFLNASNSEEWRALVDKLRTDFVYRDGKYRYTILDWIL